MQKPARYLFVLTDGGRARFVERAEQPERFVTVEELDHTERLRVLRQELRASPQPRTFANFSPRRAGVGRESYVQQAKEAFMAEVAQRASAMIRERRLDGVVLAAPSRLIAPLRSRFDGRTSIVASIRKDLTKAPDHELGDWLDGAARKSPPPT